MATIDGIYLQNITTVEELRAAVEMGFGKLVGQLNRRLTTEDQDFNEHRLMNVGYPADLHDAVNVEFLKNMFGRIALPRSKGGGAGGSGADYRDIVFGVNGALVVGDDLNPHYISLYTGTFEICGFKVKTAPTGSDVLCQVVINGTDDLFSTSITIPAGATAVQTKTDFAVTTINFLDVLTFNITQVGSPTAGTTLTVFIRFKVKDSPLG